MDAIDQYSSLLSRLDTEIERLSRFYGPRLNCRPGCSSCCTELTLLPIEAAAIRRACLFLPDELLRIINRQAAADDDGCPFLHQRQCLIYPSRPVICRTHGLPVAYADQERELLEVSACPENFAAEHQFEPADLLFLDPYNEQLLLLNSQMRAATATRQLNRISMRHLLAALPFQQT